MTSRRTRLGLGGECARGSIWLMRKCFIFGLVWICFACPSAFGVLVSFGSWGVSPRGRL